MTAPLSPAELLAAEVLAARHNASSSTSSLSVAAFHGDARAVVAAVRDLIAAEALERFADKVDAFPPGGEALSGAYWYRDGLRDAAAIARDDAFAARQSLSLPASKETQQ